jgi:hypothetical protein
MKPSKSRRELPARKAAAALIADGYAVCRIEPNEKRPTYPRWATRSIDPDDVESGDGIGIVCGPMWFARPMFFWCFIFVTGVTGGIT